MIPEQKSTTKKLTGRIVFNGKTVRKWFTREGTSSPTSSLEAFSLNATIDVYAGQYFTVMDVPNEFI